MIAKRDSGDPPFVFGLEHVPLPALVCDPLLCIQWCNASLLQALGLGEHAQAGKLSDWITFAAAPGPWTEIRKLRPDEQGRFDVLLGKEPYVLCASRLTEDNIACVFYPGTASERVRGTHPSILPGRSSSRPPSGIDLLSAFISLSRELNLAQREETLVEFFASTYHKLFPGRLISIRVVDPQNWQVVHVSTSARLHQGESARLRVTRESIAEHTGDCVLLPELVKQGKLELTDSYHPIFGGALDGFDLLLCDAEHVYGVVNFEYNEPAGAPDEDRPLVVPLCHQLCAALRNARLLAETIYLKEYLETLLDRANAPVLVLDKERRIKVVNQAMEQLSGYHRDQIIGDDFIELIPARDHARLLPIISRAVRGESLTNIELTLPHADGEEETHIIFSTAVTRSPAGEVDAVILVGQDLTEIRLLQQQVIHSEKLATLGQVAAGVAHELNNPLTSISVYGSYLANKLMGQVEDGDLAKLRRIVESAERIKSVTRDLVSYARPSAEEPQLIKVPDLVTRVLSFCEHVLDERKTTVEIQLEEGLPPIYGIRGQIEQVLVNLVTNACHAMISKGGQITISGVMIDEERLELAISDTGHGISLEHLDRIFDPFFTTKHEGVGTGLGLSIVRNILVNHNAEIDVTSEVGQGTTFKIRMFVA